jgi:hypothetical protein
VFRLLILLLGISLMNLWLPSFLQTNQIEVWILSLHPFLSRIYFLFSLIGSLAPLLFIFKLHLPPLSALISPLTLLVLGFLMILVPGLMLYNFSSKLLAMIGFLLTSRLCNAISLVYQRARLPSGIAWGCAPHVLVFYICYASPLGCVVVGLLFR